MQPKNKRGSKITEDIKLLLGAMNMRYPNYVAGTSLYRAVQAVSVDYNTTRLLRDLTYLNDDGFVKFRGLHGIDAMVLNMVDCAFALTPRGYELVNGMITDEAIGQMPDLS